jgi:putative transposase
LWRSIKYEELYLRAYESVSDARNSIGHYFEFYNVGVHIRALTAAHTSLPLRLAA